MIQNIENMEIDEKQTFIMFSNSQKIIYCNVKYLYLLINSKITNSNVYNSCLYPLYHVISIE